MRLPQLIEGYVSFGLREIKLYSHYRVGGVPVVIGVFDMHHAVWNIYPLKLGCEPQQA